METPLINHSLPLPAALTSSAWISLVEGRLADEADYAGVDFGDHPEYVDYAKVYTERRQSWRRQSLTSWLKLTRGL